MGAQQSKEELVYEQVKFGNVEGIRSLHREGAGLEWMDKEGRTPLMLACLLNPPEVGVEVVHTLLQLGANVNAYRPGTHQGTPLHHAAKRGILQTVHLLLSHAANPFRLNDDCHTPLDLARAKGHCSVVRAIENHICIFSGCLRELHGPSFLEALASQCQWLSTNIWAVVLPCDYRNPTNPLKFELAIYTDSKVAQPRTTIALWKVRIEDLNINQLNPMVVIIDKSNRTKHKFLSAHEGDKQQLLWFYNACRGIVQQGAPAVPIPQGHHPVATASAPPTSAPPSAAEDTELEMAINASIQSAITEGLSPFPNPSQSVPQSTNSSNPMHSSSSAASASGSAKTQGSCAAQIDEDQSDLATSIPATQGVIPPVASAPLATEATLANNDDAVRYPVIDTSPVVGVQIPVTEGSKIGASKDGGGASDDSSGSCVICLDAPVEGACVPCGHMAGCMSCLNEVKAKGWGCPVCRTKIDQVIKLFSV